MSAFHIHIRGRVQGVGFRPAVALLAAARKLGGTVSNGRDGVHIVLHTCETVAKDFLDTLMTSPPEHSIVTGYVFEALNDPTLYALPPTPYTLSPIPSFQIIDSNPSASPDLLLTPDIALCDDCRAELTESNNRRTCYAFTTCLHCGPRYSITTALPYDRVNTTMAALEMCPKCQSEYTDIHNRRHYSQTNTCPACAIPMHWYPSQGLESALTRASDGTEWPTGIPLSVFDRQHAVIHEAADAMVDGKIVAIKGIGGYLLCCDATNPEVVMRLRAHKHRPYKPFAVMYPDLALAMIEHDIRSFEAEALTGPVAPIVLCRKHAQTFEFRHHSSDLLHRTGIMLPYTPLMHLISRRANRPLVATSGNLSGSPILYRDEAALDLLWEVADAVLTYDREIVVPQDDSVWQFTDNGERIILRRSRGMAPDYYPHSLGTAPQTIFAAGADLKAAFALHHGDKVYISQYLGDLEDYRSQQAWTDTRDHLLRLVEAQPQLVLTDLHPSYYARQEALSFAERLGVSVIGIQHHEAHVAAVLEENGLLRHLLPVLGLAWDGTGYGTDGHAWGSEAFIVEKGSMDRVLHLDYFPQLLGDKMSREPRLSALSLLHGHHDARKILQVHFSEAEWDYYQKLLQQPTATLTSSMGRLIDGIASILGIRQISSYEGQAAMELEALADSVDMNISTPYHFTIRQERIDWRPMLQVLLGDLYSGVPREMIARRFFSSLAQLVVDIGWCYDIPRIACSGGVFQNALLIDLIRERLPAHMQLFLHRKLSPNDECIALGQLAWYSMKSRISKVEFRK
jgi:hydrogenase maturation protein HypF